MGEDDGILNVYLGDGIDLFRHFVFVEPAALLLEVVRRCELPLIFHVIDIDDGLLVHLLGGEFVTVRYFNVLVLLGEHAQIAVLVIVDHPAERRKQGKEERRHTEEVLGERVATSDK